MFVKTIKIKKKKKKKRKWLSKQVHKDGIHQGIE